MKKYLVYVLLATLFCACSPYALVNSETYNNADLADYKTFRIVTPEEGHMPPGMQMVTYYNIAAAIREQMVERGYTESPSSPLLINIGITVHKELMTEPVVPPHRLPPHCFLLRRQEQSTTATIPSSCIRAQITMPVIMLMPR